jgi:iron(III) transport system permease protein
VALTGKGGSRTLTPLGPWRWLVLGYAVFVVSLAVILPYAALGKAAFSKAWGLGFTLANVTLENFHRLLAEEARGRPSSIPSPIRRAPHASPSRSRCSPPMSSTAS